MLNNDDALRVWDHLRGRLVNAGFGDFDAFAYSLVSDEFMQDDPQNPTSPTLLRYLAVVQGLLKRIGKTQIDETKAKLSQALGLDAGIDIEIDISEVRAFVGNNVPNFLPLEGSSFAENLAHEFSQLYYEIETFQYSNPSPSAPRP